MSTTVTYKGNVIATVENNTKTLETAGMYMEDDVTLTDVTSGGYIDTSDWTKTAIYANGNPVDYNAAMSPTNKYSVNVSATVLSGARCAVGFYDSSNVFLGKVASDGSIDKVSGSWTYFTGDIDVGAYAPNNAVYVLFVLFPTDGTTLTNETYKAWASTHLLIYGNYQTKSNISPTESSQNISADNGYDALESVQINAIPSNYVGSGITQRSSSDLTASGATVSVPAGYYGSAASKAVASGSAGTPSASKGTVSNNSISVTPSVTNTAGYISGGTINGTAVSVTASELVSGSETKTTNGTYDVTNLAELIVNVSPIAKKVTGTFTGNGSRSVTVSCAFEPDLVYWTSDPGTSSSSGTVSCLIARGMLAANQYRNNSTTNSNNIQAGITGMNTGGSSYNFRATYSDGTVTLYCFSTGARSLFTNNRTYSYTFVKWTA